MEALLTACRLRSSCRCRLSAGEAGSTLTSVPVLTRKRRLRERSQTWKRQLGGGRPITTVAISDWLGTWDVLLPLNKERYTYRRHQQTGSDTSRGRKQVAAQHGWVQDCWHVSV